MTQHDDAVEQQRQILEVEKQARQIVAIDKRSEAGSW